MMGRQTLAEISSAVLTSVALAAFLGHAIARLNRPTSTPMDFRLEAVSWSQGADASTGTRSESPSVLRLAFVGDIMQHRAQAQDDFDESYRGVAAWMSRQDIAAGNLEFPVDPTRAVGPAVDSTQFNGSESHLAALSRAGFDLLSTANNHCFDQGLDGIVRTTAEIRRHGMMPVGNLSGPEQEHPVVVARSGLRIGYCAYTFRPNSYKDSAGRVTYWKREWPIHELNFADWTAEYRDKGRELFARHVAAARADRVDWLVALVHWGHEWQFQPTEDQRRAARDLIDAGFDLVVGGHGHVINPLETYRDRVVAYSLGNFISAFARDEARLGAVLQVELTRNAQSKLVVGSFRALPVTVDWPGHRVRFVSRDDGHLARLAQRVLGPACVFQAELADRAEASVGTGERDSAFRADHSAVRPD